MTLANDKIWFQEPHCVVTARSKMCDNTDRFLHLFCHCWVRRTSSLFLNTRNVLECVIVESVWVGTDLHLCAGPACLARL